MSVENGESKMSTTDNGPPKKTDPDTENSPEEERPWPARADPDRLLLVPEVAAALRASESFVYQIIGEGRLRHVRLGKGQGGIRVPASAVNDFLAARTRGGNSEASTPSQER